MRLQVRARACACVCARIYACMIITLYYACAGALCAYVRACERLYAYLCVRVHARARARVCVFIGKSARARVGMHLYA